MAHDDHSAHSVNYLYVFGALCGFTALSVLFDQMGGFASHRVIIVLVLAVAVAKALCVMMFFMHLKFEGNWKYVLLAPTTILAIGLPLALMPDIGVSYYEPLAPQAGDWGVQMEDYKAHHAEHEAAEGESGDVESGAEDAVDENAEQRPGPDAAVSANG